ncbi:MAG: molybdopterin cofactor-binding domain-containing protein [Pseudomonadota bacterium]
MRDQVAGVMGIPIERLRVTSDDIGGAFGMKTSAYPEYPALLVAAKLTGRAVHWMSTRSEAFISDNQARDTVMEAELALDNEGRFLALRMRAIAAMGAFLTSHGAHIATNNFAPLPADALSRAGGRGRGALRLHQYAADRALSRRRATRSQLCDGAADR